MSMKLSFSQTDLQAAAACLASIIKAGNVKEPEMKQNSLEYKILQENKVVAEKIQYAADIMSKKLALGSENPEVEVEFNRTQAKVLIATMVHTSAIQAAVLMEYEKRPDDHKAFANVDGRRKVDYVTRLKARSDEVSNVLNKIRKAL